MQKEFYKLSFFIFSAETGGTLNIPDGLGGITVHPVTASELVRFLKFL